MTALALDGVALVIVLVGLLGCTAYRRQPEIAIASLLVTVSITIALYAEIIVSFLRSL